MNGIRFEMQSILAALAALTLSACATTLTSSVDTADDAQLHGFMSYAWISDEPVFVSNPTAPTVINPLNAQRIRTAIEFELARKGYRKVPMTQADLVLSASLGTHDRVQVRDYYDDLGYSVRTFTEGTLLVDVFENRHKEAIWHGSASKRLSHDYAVPELIDEAVMTLLQQFPDQDAMRKVVKDEMS